MKYEYFSGSVNPLNALQVARYNQQFRKEHPEYFDPDGIIVFCGPQGSGKTLSAVAYVQKLCRMYPSVKVVSNMTLNLPDGIEFIPWSGVQDFTNVNNDYAGVIFLLDEIHLEFNSLESKKMDSNIFTVVSQQRKQRKHIVGTSQVFNRIAKPFREQFNLAVDCHNYFRFIQVNYLVDAKHSTEEGGRVVSNSLKRFVWFHSPNLYKSYDTYAVMKRYRDDWKG